MILRGDLDLSRRKLLDGVVSAAMPEFEFEGLRAARQRQDLMTEANAEDRVFSEKSFDRSHGFGTSFGSPGPFDKKTPFGESARISSAGVFQGTIVTRQPRFTRERTMFFFIPQSIATT